MIRFIQNLKAKNPGYSKDQIASATAQEFNLNCSRSVFHCADFAIRFSTASSASFSNVVLSLSALMLYDKRPFVVCIVRPAGVDFLLANASFLRKISHSSHQLRVDNVKGSFLGHDIMRDFDGLRNAPENFEELFARHAAFTWDENLLRLTEATTAIVPTGARFTPSASQVKAILSAATLASKISRTPEYSNIQHSLDLVIRAKRDAILKAAEVENVNQRGNSIEQIITSSGNLHGIEDLMFVLEAGLEVHVDVKTKLLNRASSPKGYNIDKFLKLLATGNGLLAFFFVGIDLKEYLLVTRLVSALDDTILMATRIQFHWAGRNSRGVTQLAGDLSPIFADDFKESIHTAKAVAFLQKLINL